MLCTFSPKKKSQCTCYLDKIFHQSHLHLCTESLRYTLVHNEQHYLHQSKEKKALIPLPLHTFQYTF